MRTKSTGSGTFSGNFQSDVYDMIDNLLLSLRVRFKERPRRSMCMLMRDRCRWHNIHGGRPRTKRSALQFMIECPISDKAL